MIDEFHKLADRTHDFGFGLVVLAAVKNFARKFRVRLAPHRQILRGAQMPILASTVASAMKMMKKTPSGPIIVAPTLMV